MDTKTYSITLADGTVIDNLSLNGNNFVSKTSALDSSIFEGNCSPVTISDGETETIHENMALVQIMSYIPGEYCFVLRDISAEELSAMKIQSDIEYIAMMTGVEL